MFTAKEEIENFIVHIEDDFDLGKIADSGQCFRVKKFEEDTYRFITGDQAVYIRQSKEGEYRVSCNEDTWAQVWTKYFDLSRNYRVLRKKREIEILLWTGPYRREQESVCCVRIPGKC